MKRFLLFIVVTVLAIGVSAQKLNSRGEKMVAKLEIEGYNYAGNANSPVYCVGHTTIKFGYDDTHLNSVEAKAEVEFMDRKEDRFGDTEECTFKLSNGTLTRKDYYNGRQITTGEWKYIFDGDIITKFEQYDYSLDGSGECLRDDTNFYYTTADSGYPTLCGSLKEWYVRMAGTKHFVKGDDEESGIRQVYRYRDGDPDIIQCSTPKSYVDPNEFDEHYVYGTLGNDLNINWYVQIVSFAQIGGFNAIPLMTEWAPCKNAHLPFKNKWKNLVYSYLYDCGNLRKVFITSSGVLTEIITITYVEE